MQATTAASGMLLFIRYAFMPNHLGYCGSDDPAVLFEHATEGRADPRLAPLLTAFTGALPYLQTIAAAAGIRNAFDERVVEAYWLGNELLERVEARRLYDSLEQRFGAQLPAKVKPYVLRKPPEGARPVHFFHVADVYRHLEGEEVGMAALDDCRISWGQVERVEGAELVVARQPVVLQRGKLVLDEPQIERVLRAFEGRGFADGAAPGDWVSIHWGWVCEVLDARKLSNLRRYTSHHLALANQTL